MTQPSQSSPYRLMVIEDDLELASLIGDYLSKHGFMVEIIADGAQAAKAIVAQQPDFVLLDIMLPGMTGMEVCKQVRPHYTGPIIMLTALDEDMDQMLGLELGADDYIIKPVQPRLLLSRIRALLRRVQTPLSSTLLSTPMGEPYKDNNTDTVQVAELTISLRDRIVRQHGTQLELTTAEFELLLMLAKEAGQVVSRDLIIKQLRGLDYDGLDRSIDRRISRLRKKLEVPNQQAKIKTIRGKGYQLCLN